MSYTSCTAKAKTTGQRCKRRPIPGGTVCKIHGGGAPQVRQAARDRLAALAHPAIDALQKALEADDMSAAIRAAHLVLDRAGVKPMTDVEAFYNEQADVLHRLIDGILSAFGIRLGAPHVAAIIRRELSRVAGVDLDGTERVDVPKLSAYTRERIAAELRGEQLEEPTEVLM